MPYDQRGVQIENLKNHFDKRFDNLENNIGYLVSRVFVLEKMVK